MAKILWLIFLIPAIVATMSADLNDNPVSDTCLVHLVAWVENLNSVWSARLMDSMSKFPEGILTGHQNSYGDFDECLATRGTVNISDAGTLSSSFKGQYCLANVVSEISCQSSLKRQSLFSPNPTIALCVPNKCSKEDLQSLLVTMLNDTGVCVVVNHCQTDDPPKLRQADIGMIILLSLLAGLCMVGTALDLAIVKVGTKARTINWAGGTLFAEDSRKRKLVQVLIAFSVCTNVRQWLNTQTTGDNLGCLHGIRFLSTCWVVLSHTWSTWLSKAWNTAEMFSIYKNWTLFPIINGSVSVDTFLTMSGLLVAYNLLKMLDRTKGRLNLPIFYLHRYLRLTPTYAIVIGILATFFEHLRPGPNTPELAHAAQSCRKYWWHNLVYINNLVPYNGFVEPDNAMCHGESWYLANDMQFYWISPLLLVPLWKCRTFGSILMGIVTAASVLVPCMVTYTQELPATLLAGSSDTETVQRFWTESYTKPWMRFGPYVVGLWAGYFLYIVRKNYSIMKPSGLVILCGWITSTAVALAVIFGPMHFFDPANAYERLPSAIYAGCHRFAWGLVISWVILACVLGYGGFINTFLSWKVFIPLGRLSFCTYLISVWLQSLYIFSARQALNYDLYTGINYFFAHMVMSLLVSFVVCITCESPFIALEKILFPVSHGAVKGQTNQKVMNCGIATIASIENLNYNNRSTEKLTVIDN